MIARRLTPALAIGVLAVAFPPSAIGHTATQQEPTADETPRGISLQQQGKTEEAVAPLRAAVKRNRNDLRAWHHLGLALERQITGTVVLRAIFAANGRVIGIRAVSGLPGGLTEQAIHAARQIRFVPAIKDGRPVSMFIQLEYNFNFY